MGAVHEGEDFMLEIYIARHAESEGNVSFARRGCVPSSTDFNSDISMKDPELTERGVAQAAALGERLSISRFDAIFSSPLVRAITTAHEVSVRQEGGAVPIELLPDLMEVSTDPDFTGRPYEKLVTRFPQLLPYPAEPTPTGGLLSIGVEPDYAAPFRRSERCIGYFKSRFSHGERIFVAAHGTYNTCLILSAIGLGSGSGMRFCQENTGLTKIRYYHDGQNSWGNVKVVYANDTSHLYSDSPELTYKL